MRSLLVGLLLAATSLTAAPFYVDLQPVANRSWEDDGIAGNNAGGWTDEGINDLYIYPPITPGEIYRNGHHFTVIDPAKNGGKALVMLRGRERAKDCPEEVRIAVPKRTAKYAYFLQNAASQVKGEPQEYVVATYALEYADGTRAELPVRDTKEIRQWWTGNWYDNSGAGSWPIFMGINLYSMKWKQYLGVWAMRWENPNPGKPITAIVLRSAVKSVPAIFAITLDDEDYDASPDIKQHYVRPDGPPAGYFTCKEDQERSALFAELAKTDHVKGVRRIDLIRPDLLAVTVDPALGRIGVGAGAEIAAKLQAPANFTVTSPGDPAYAAGIHPAKVSRQSYEYWVGDIGPFPMNMLFWHTYYLALPSPLKPGAEYTVKVGGIDAPYCSEMALAYDPAKTITPAIKVNQAAYAANVSRRYAYLGWWAGDGGKVDDPAATAFEVVAEADGKVVLKGAIAVRAADDKGSGEEVREMDLAAVPTGGPYHIRIPGLGRSDSFFVGGKALKELYVDTQRAFFHQRCGCELPAANTSFPRPPCHLECYESGYLVGNPDYVPKPGEKIGTFRGGYHDAGDDDCFTYHLRATAQVLAIYEKYPKSFKDNELNIPESGNGIPDVLDEADWALFFYRDHQQADGAVPLGRGNDQDYISKDYGKDRPAFGILPPETTSCAEFAAVSAQYSRVIRPFDAKRADSYLTAAKRAFAWAQANPTGGKHAQGALLFRAWAAAELFKATGEQEFNQAFLALHREGAVTKAPWNLAQYVHLCAWPYATCEQPGTDEAVREELRKRIIQSADSITRSTEETGYRMGLGKRLGCGWGNGNGGGNFGDPCIRAFILTGERKYLDTASLNADYLLGCNPLSRTFVTGIGARPPNHPQLSPRLFAGPNKTGAMAKGITIYGPAGNPDKPMRNWYPELTPAWRCYRDLHGGAEISSEFTITETIGATAILTAMLHVIAEGGDK